VAQWVDARFKDLLKPLMPAIESSLDPVCVVDAEKRIVYLTTAMSSLIGLRARELARGVSFCEAVKFGGHGSGCHIRKIIDGDEAVRVDQVPATIGGERRRVLFKGVPVRGASGKAELALVSLRDTTGEVLLQAKYHKTLMLLDHSRKEGEELRERVKELRDTLRRAAHRRISR
jgi:PAS domain S-box-containing protein